MKKFLLLLSVSAALVAGAVPETSSILARQMWPWSADYRVVFRTSCPLDESWDVTLTVSNGAEAFVIPNGKLTGDAREIGPGEHVVTWDPSSVTEPSSEWLAANAGKLTFSVGYTASTNVAEYLIVDLSGGASAASYPAHTYKEPELRKWGVIDADGYWADEYKTTKLAFRRIRAGSYVAGPKSEDEIGRIANVEDVGVAVTLTNDFWLGVFELTGKQVELVQGLAAASGKENYAFDGKAKYVIGYEGTNWPHHAVTGADSVCGLLTAKADLPAEVPAGWQFFLPSEAQWEYACRAGTSSAYNNGTDPAPYKKEGIGYEFDDNLAPIAWYRGNLIVWGPYTVGLKLPNNWGLFDMHGNLSELCNTCNVGKMFGGTEPIGNLNYFGTKNGLAYWCVRGGNMRSASHGYYAVDTVAQYRSGARSRVDSQYGPDTTPSYLGYRLAILFARGSKD